LISSQAPIVYNKNMCALLASTSLVVATQATEHIGERDIHTNIVL
jgi:hypothetical protein